MFCIVLKLLNNHVHICIENNILSTTLCKYIYIQVSLLYQLCIYEYSYLLEEKQVYI